MENKQATHGLELQIDQLILSCQKFQVILLREFESLKGSNPDQLLDCISEKQALIDQLFRQESHLRTHIRGSFQTPLNLVLRQFLETVADESLKQLLEAKLDQLVSLLEKCKTQNQINGGIISHNLELNRRIIAALIKPAKPAHAVTYNEKGKVG